eukprot:1138339-Pelagomonas_calceolata.AAC.7
MLGPKKCNCETVPASLDFEVGKSKPACRLVSYVGHLELSEKGLHALYCGVEQPSAPKHTNFTRSILLALSASTAAQILRYYHAY